MIIKVSYKILVLLVTLWTVLFFNSNIVFATEWYASPEGVGSGETENSPFRISDFWDFYQSGDVLWLLDGEYTGVANMIFPPNDYSLEINDCNSYGGGTSELPVVIRTMNEGQVTLNGESSRVPVTLICQKYITIIGVNAHNSSGTVFTIHRTEGIVVQRSIGWDADISGNYKIFQVSSSDNTLLEDVAGFGTARKILSSSSGGQNTTIRRAWLSWDGSESIGPKMALTLAYNNNDLLAENILATWTSNELSPGYNVDQPYGVISTDRMDDDSLANTKLLGSLAYLEETSEFSASALIRISGIRGLELKDIITYASPDVFNDEAPISLGNVDISPNNLSMTNASALGAGTAIFQSNWTVSNYVEADYLQELNFNNGNPFTGSAGGGGALCFRYVDGQKTSTPLWPWPMNDRIKEATVYSGKEEIDVNAKIESMFGAIPEECQSTSPTPEASPEEDLGASTASTNFNEVHTSMGDAASSSAPTVKVTKTATGEIQMSSGPYTDKNKGKLIFSGSSIPNSFIQIRIQNLEGGVIVGSTMVGTTGNWMWVPTLNVRPGSYVGIFTAQDRKGNIGITTLDFNIESNGRIEMMEVDDIPKQETRLQSSYQQEEKSTTTSIIDNLSFISFLENFLMTAFSKLLN